MRAVAALLTAAVALVVMVLPTITDRATDDVLHSDREASQPYVPRYLDTPPLIEWTRLHN